jgi:hypothetical protein
MQKFSLGFENLLGLKIRNCEQEGNWYISSIEGDLQSQEEY